MSPLDSALRGRNEESPMLSDLQILDRLVAEEPDCLFVTPLSDPETQLGPSSLDVRLGAVLVLPTAVAATHIDLTLGREKVEEQLRKYFKRRPAAEDLSFVVHPGEFALASTLEVFRFPGNLAGRLEGRSSLGRLGLQVHATAGFVDPGFEGTLTFELSNAGKLPIKVQPGLRLGQLCFFELEEVQREYMHKPGRKYGRKLEPEMTRIFDDAELGKNVRSESDSGQTARSLIAFVTETGGAEDTGLQES